LLVYGQHRSLALAERHRRELERGTGKPVKIIARRNSRGEYSERGQFFTFEVSEKKRQEYAFRATYTGSKKKGNSFEAEIHFSAPSGLAKDDALTVIATWTETGMLPEDWKEPKAVMWNEKEYTEDRDIEVLREVLVATWDSLEKKIVKRKRRGDK